MVNEFRRIDKNTYLVELPIPFRSNQKLMAYIFFKEDGSIIFNPIQYGRNIGPTESSLILSYVLTKFSENF